MRRHRARGQCLAQPLGETLGAFEVGLGKEDGELLAAVPRRRTDLADGRAQDVGERLKDVVASLVAVAVVDLLEVVEVGEDEREAPAEALGAGDLALERLFEVAAVWEAR